MPIAELVDGRIVLSDTAYRDRDSIHSISGARFRDDQWSMPVTWTGIRHLSVAFGARLSIGQDLKDWAWRVYAERVEPTLQARTAAMDPDQDVSPEFAAILDRIEQCHA